MSLASQPMTRRDRDRDLAAFGGPAPLRRLRRGEALSLGVVIGENADLLHAGRQDQPADPAFRQRGASACGAEKPQGREQGFDSFGNDELAVRSSASPNQIPPPAHPLPATNSRALSPSGALALPSRREEGLMRGEFFTCGRRHPRQHRRPPRPGGPVP